MYNDAGLIAAIGRKLWDQLKPAVRARLRKQWEKRLVNAPEYANFKKRS